ncbi:MAG: TraR/DksA family transcriptional regulator [Bdellovibrionaceae bacterium]|nr:TraR/DksA family transcriptional regulator [Pseudobdellovibrionaceae bacterium]
MTVSEKLLEKCKSKLVEAKSDVLNRVKEARKEVVSEEKGGDEADQTVRALAETEFLSKNERLRSRLMEIEQALFRIENGTYGVCEETEEPIEKDRLFAIPWTRLSIEGAEIRESMNYRFAQ